MKSSNYTPPLPLWNQIDTQSSLKWNPSFAKKMLFSIKTTSFRLFPPCQHPTTQTHQRKTHSPHLQSIGQITLCTGLPWGWCIRLWFFRLLQGSSPLTVFEQRENTTKAGWLKGNLENHLEKESSSEPSKPPLNHPNLHFRGVFYLFTWWFFQDTILILSFFAVWCWRGSGKLIIKPFGNENVVMLRGVPKTL